MCVITQLLFILVSVGITQTTPKYIQIYPPWAENKPQGKCLSLAHFLLCVPMYKNWSTVSTGSIKAQTGAICLLP